MQYEDAVENELSSDESHSRSLVGEISDTSLAARNEVCKLGQEAVFDSS